MRGHNHPSAAGNQEEPDRDTSRDPYALWIGRPEAELPFDEVRDGVAVYLRTFYSAVWYANTPNPIPWYLLRVDGLNAWCKWEASQRLSQHYRETYSITDFHELIFREDLKRSGSEALQKLFWSPLIVAKQLAGDSGFLKQISNLVNQPEAPMHQGMRTFCIYWDRETIPFAFWSYPAIARRIEWETRGETRLSVDAIKNWAHRLGLKQSHPIIVRRYDSHKEPIIDAEAFQFHGIPDLPDK